MASEWTPPKELISFIQNNDRIVFITFGSMTNPEPIHKTQIILDILSKHKIPAIINTASGGLVKPDQFPGHVFFTDQIPYSWIFPRIYAVVHHGGSGTVHTAIKCGCANLIIPHILDQHIWNDLIAEKNIGPSGISIKKFSYKKFESLLLKLYRTDYYKQNALGISNRMKHENLEDYFIQTISSDV